MTVFVSRYSTHAHHAELFAHWAGLAKLATNHCESNGTHQVKQFAVLNLPTFTTVPHFDRPNNWIWLLSPSFSRAIIVLNQCNPKAVQIEIFFNEVHGY
jgi:hypothetical protein